MDFQLENGASPGGVFPGVRLFNMDSETFDPVPWITVLLNFQHAKLGGARVFPTTQPRTWRCVKLSPHFLFLDIAAFRMISWTCFIIYHRLVPRAYDEVEKDQAEEISSPPTSPTASSGESPGRYVRCSLAATDLGGLREVDVCGASPGAGVHAAHSGLHARGG